MFKNINKNQIAIEVKRFALTIVVFFFFYISFAIMGFTDDNSKELLFSFTLFVLSLLIINALKLFVEENEIKTIELNLISTLLSFLFLLNIFWDRLDFFANELEQVLPLINLVTIIVAILGILKVFIERNFFSLLVIIINNILLVIIAIQLWIVFPFNLDLLNGVFRILIITAPFLYTFYSVFSSVKYLKDYIESINEGLIKTYPGEIVLKDILNSLEQLHTKSSR